MMWLYPGAPRQKEALFMTLQQLAYLVAVAECGSITDAAERLFISQPSLSAAIHNLEKEMGVTAFVRSNKGVAVTREGEELLSFARMLLEQADIMQEHFGAGRRRDPRFCVSCQHYSFAVNAFVDVVQQYDADRYSFILRETQTGEIIDDVSSGRSELGLLYLCESNESVLSKLLRKNELVFEALFTAEPHVFISRDHPLAARARITLDELRPYPYLVFEQGERNSFYFSEELLSMLDMPKTIQVRDRATLFSLVIGLNGFTVSSGIIDPKLNSPSIIARPLDMDGSMRIGLIPQEKRGGQPLCRILCRGVGKAFVHRLKKTAAGLRLRLIGSLSLYAYQFSSGKCSGSAFGCSNVVVVSQKTCSRALLRMHSITSSECSAMSPEARGMRPF